MATKRAPAKPKKASKKVVETVVSSPTYNAEGVLQNPSSFHVTSEGLLRPKGGQ